MVPRLASCFLLMVFAATSFAQDLKDVPDVAQQEIDRRGNFVERIDGYRNDVTDLIAEALRPPADDSHKWFITVITTRSCQYCEALKRDFESSTDLRAFVDQNDHKQSWAHYNVFRVEDQTQAWRWEGIRLAGYPTILVQPPRDDRYGDAKTVVLQKTGYDGDARKLAATMRNAITAYVAKLPQQPHRGGIGQATDQTEQQQRGYEPPFSPPPRVEPTPYAPMPQYPFDVPPVPQPQPQQPLVNPLSLLASLLGSLLGSGGMTNLLLLVLTAFALIRTFRKATGQKLLLDDAAYQNLVDNLKKLIDPQTPKNPNANP
jgi:hypothetical protein